MKTTWVLLLAVACAFTASVVAKVGDAQGQGRAGGAPQAPVAPMPPAPAPVLTPEDALKSLTVAPGYKVEIAASEPLIHAPVAIQFGPDGRLWVVEMNGYSPVLGGLGEDDANGRVVVLRDRDGDGRYDDATVFLENLDPAAIDHARRRRRARRRAAGAGVLARHERRRQGGLEGRDRQRLRREAQSEAAAVDQRRVVSERRALGVRQLDLQRRVHEEVPIQGRRSSRPARRSSAGSGGSPRTTSAGSTTTTTPIRSTATSSSATTCSATRTIRASRAPTSTSRRTSSSGRRTRRPGVTSGGQPARELHDGRLFKFTAACGPWIYRGDLLPDLYGNAFVAEPVGNLVQRKVLTAENGTLIGRNPYDRADFIASTDERFRPVNFGTGPDGALYVVDMYRGIVEHHSLISAYLREEIKSHQLEGPYELRPHLPRRADRQARAARRADRDADERAVGGAPRRRERVVARDRAAAARRAARGGDGPGDPTDRDVQHATARPRAGAVDARRCRRARSRQRDGRLERQGTGRAGRRAAPQRAPVQGRGRPRGSARARPGVDEGSGARSAVAGGAHVRRSARRRRQDVALAQAVRAQPGNRFLRDALLQRPRESRASAHRAARRRCRVAGPPTPRPTRSSPASRSGVFGSRQVPAIERLIALAAAQPPAATARTAALVDGIVAAATGPGAARRPIQFPKEPDGWASASEER